jgi:hypothetical protein
MFLTYTHMGRDSAVGIATRYKLDGLEIEFRLGRDFPHLFRQDLGPSYTSTPIMGLRGLF